MNLDAIILAELQRGGPPLWVSGRTYPKGATVRSLTNLQQYVRKVAGAGATDPSADSDNWEPWSKTVDTTLATLATNIANVKAVVDAISAAPRGIKSIQRGISTIPTNGPNRYIDVTIAAVVPAKTTTNLLSASVLSSGSYDGWYLQQVSLINATTLRVTGGLSIYNSSNYSYSYSGQQVSWEVVEYH